jgi:DNA-directed RNA polymerase I, II, and III subunit RPABC2
MDGIEEDEVTDDSEIDDSSIEDLEDEIDGIEEEGEDGMEELEEEPAEEEDMRDDEEEEGTKMDIGKTEKRKKEEKKKEIFSEKDYESESDSEPEEEIEMNHLQKFNEDLNISFLEKMHPEIQAVDYQEMIALARIVRDKNGRIVDPLHKTIPFLTKYERARIIGARAEQIDHGGEPFITIEESIINGRTIALMEFEAKKIPFIIARPLPNGGKEYWHLQDLEILD